MDQSRSVRKLGDLLNASEIEQGQSLLDDQIAARPSLVPEPATDLADATGAFAKGVDTLTSALLVILSQLEESLAQQKTTNYKMGWIIWVNAAAVLAAAIWAVWYCLR